MEDAQVNLLAIIIAAAAYFGLGGLWYSKKVFGNLFMREAGMKEMKVDKTKLIGEAVIGIVIAAILALLMNLSDFVTIGGGLKIGFLSWLGFSATTQICGVLWGKVTLKMFYINAGFLLVAYLIMGAIIGAIG